MDRFIRIMQDDIVTKPENWVDALPNKFIKLSNRAKNAYCVLSVIAFSVAGNGEGKVVNGGVKLGKGWFWTSHAIIQQLTGTNQKTVQRAIKELQDAGFIGYHPAKKTGQQCFFKIKRVKYNQKDQGQAVNQRAEKSSKAPEQAAESSAVVQPTKSTDRKINEKKTETVDPMIIYKHEYGFKELLTPEEIQQAEEELSVRLFDCIPARDKAIDAQLQKELEQKKSADLN